MIIITIITIMMTGGITTIMTTITTQNILTPSTRTGLKVLGQNRETLRARPS
jgi:uncharacterized protein YceK